MPLERILLLNTVVYWAWRTPVLAVGGSATAFKERINRMDRRSRLLLSLLVALLAPHAATGTTVHGNFLGINYDYLGVQETSTFGDPEPLFGAPIIVGDSLVFSPTTFSASAAGAGGFDQTGAQLQATIDSTGTGPIDQIFIDEFGEVDLSGIGTGATGAFISMSGVVTVLETGAGVPCIACQIPFVGTFTPSDAGISVVRQRHVREQRGRHDGYHGEEADDHHLDYSRARDLRLAGRWCARIGPSSAWPTNPTWARLSRSELQVGRSGPIAWDEAPPTRLNH
jgi:hypothetical protein